MDKYFDARKRMVDNQLLKRGIKNQRVIDAMLKVPRHLFVAKKNLRSAYDDSPLSIDCSQTISQPYIVALMTELIEPQADMNVLEIGTGSGYQSAILAEVCQQVYSVERHRELASQAKEILLKLGYDNVKIKTADGTIGWRAKAPFDAIVVTAAAPNVPEQLVNQLKDHGKMVVPVGSQYQQNLTVVEKRGDSYFSRIVCGCVFVPLVGKNGWNP
ncbi:MAG: protein-L-isoaspartate(D-aspartate) O-methyltransferase [bacterium]|nr:protein-L-isoaspartate(D-aspartate) O-methyltransferase [bacterium]